MLPPKSSHRRSRALTLLWILSSAEQGLAQTPAASAEVLKEAASAPAYTDSTATASQAAETRPGDWFWRGDPRIAPSQPRSDSMKFQLHGEYILRLSAVPNVALSSYGFSDYPARSGQTHRLEHRLRFNPRFDYRDKVRIIAQLDAPYGTLVGQEVAAATQDPERLTHVQPMRVAGRWLYVEISAANGSLRVGQQPARWGSGLVLNDGDEPQFFGDSRLGTIVDRVAYQGKPLGPRSHLELLVATDLVFADQGIRLTDGDIAARALLGLGLVDGSSNRAGLLVMAEESRPRSSNDSLSALRPSQRTATLDFETKYAYRIPGHASFVSIAAEAVAVIGTTDLAPETMAPTNSRVERFGAVAQLGLATTRDSDSTRRKGWGVLFEWGYASGDANPGDRVDRRFNANPSRRVGLVLFDEVLRWKQSRMAAALEDQRLGTRPSVSAQQIPVGGGVSGATYAMLQGLFRPWANLDLRAAALLAQASADWVDPARLLINGRWSNYDAGPPSHRDLGLELDWAAEYRQQLEPSMAVAVGAEGGILFPGRGLADSSQNTLGVQRVIRGRLSFFF